MDERKKKVGIRVEIFRKKKKRLGLSRWELGEIELRIVGVGKSYEEVRLC